MNGTAQTALIQPKKESSIVEYVPFGATDKLKLSISIVQNLIAVPTRTNKTCSERDALKFMAMCQAKRLNPFEGDAFLIGYDGKDGPTFSLITAHQTYLKRAEVHPEFDGMKSGVIVETEEGEIKDLEGDFHLPDQKVLGGWATVYFKNRKHPMHKRLRLSRFQKSFGVWQDDAAGMICKCAEADALRSAFPTMLGGLYLREEVDILVEATPSAPAAHLPTSRPKFDGPPEDDDQIAGAEMGSKANPAPSETSGSAQTTSDLPPVAKNAPEATTSPQEGHSEPEPELPAEPYKALLVLCKRDGVTEGELLEHARSLKMAKPDQKLPDLSEAKLKGLIANWKPNLAVIKGARNPVQE